ncbi:MAG: hypothetical protein HQK83_20060 [Fibrobacteria bacterium]|nr:hypothetical protein [Fibrobacteria bacterium]
MENSTKNKFFLMVLFLCVTASQFLYGQQLNLTGKVIDENAQPVPNAKVFLAIDSHFEMTDANGEFNITTNSALPVTNPFKNNARAFFENGIFHFSTGKTQMLHYHVFGLNGRLLYKNKIEMNKAGNFGLVVNSLLPASFPNALYFVQITQNGRIFSVKTIKSTTSHSAPQVVYTNKVAIPLSKKTAGTIDTLIVQKTGYGNAKVYISNYTAALSPIILRALIDRKAVVTRHNITYTKAETKAPLSVGNGDMAFTVDATGLQSFTGNYDYLTLSTLSHWGWHSVPNTNNYKLSDTYKYFDYFGRQVPYVYMTMGKTEKDEDYFRKNPHRANLGRIGMELKTSGGSNAALGHLTGINQQLNLWEGIISSEFDFDGKHATVKTLVHPDKDIIVSSISSPLITSGQMKFALRLPYGSHDADGADWNNSGGHTTEILTQGTGFAVLKRTMDSTIYYVRLQWSNGTLSKKENHYYQLTPSGDSENFEFSCWFNTENNFTSPPDYATASTECAAGWESFWKEGAFIDLTDATDSRAPTLEKNIILSRYLTRIQCAGDYPPQETGLTYNSWNGKFHLEMHWWHGVHWAIWDNLDFLEKTLDWYKLIMPKAQETARVQGFAGARWPKMVGPDGRESPSPIGTLLIWQQPHPIYFAEACYRQHPTKETLEKFKDIVFQSADFMASFARLSSTTNKYRLEPPIISAPEASTNNPNPAYELTQWWYGLNTAQKWRERLGMGLDSTWKKVQDNLSPLPTQGDVYIMEENFSDYYTKCEGHPTTTAVYGMMPATPLMDTTIMRKTVEKTWSLWYKWTHAWGWDCGMIAMGAARTGRTDIAVDVLFEEKLGFLSNGHNIGLPNQGTLPAYLPGNGSLLLATGMMAGGWDNDGGVYAPGFPKDGKWNVRVEGFVKLE